MEESKSLYKISTTDVLGRHMVANKNIKQGQLILKENPIMLCPQIGGPTICFNCCVQIGKLYFCPECSSAILCNPKCKGKFHDDLECATMKSKHIRREDLITNPEIVTPLRCLLWHDSKKEHLKNLLNFETHLNARRDSEIWRRIKINIEDVLTKLKLISEEDRKNETVQNICAALDMNTFDVRQSQKNCENLRGLYFEAATMSHDCVANAHLAIDDDFVLYVRAAVDIPEGCNISFNYTNALQGNNQRGNRLQDGKNFECKCSRCSDPTELGTEMSSIKCPKCRKGYVRPNEWRCSLCKHNCTISLIKTTILECRRIIDDIASPDITILENVLKKLSTTFHPNHYLMLEIEQMLVRLYSQDSLDVEKLKKKVKLCTKFLEILKKVEPGISRTEAVALYELHSGLLSLTKKAYSNKEMTEEEFFKKLYLAEDTLKTAIKWLLYEPVKSPEGRLAQNALSELKMLREIINKFQKEYKIEKKKQEEAKV